MAKKRKVAARAQDQEEDEVQLDPRESRKRIKTYEDVADSDDEFHLNQDEIRLGEEPEAKRRRKWAEQEDFLQQSDEEVLGYSQDEEASDEELQSPADGQRDAGESESDSDNEHGNEGIEDEELAWGTSKADLYGADAIETEEQALEEEAEALRLQKKQLEAMKAADYGFDEDEWQQQDGRVEAADDGDNAVVTEVLPQLHIDPDLSPAERLKLLKTRYPEFEPLSKDLLDLQEQYSALSEAAKLSSTASLKLKAASAYIGALAMYFSLLTSTASFSDGTAVALAATRLREHPLMDSLVQCRKLWMRVVDMTEDDSSGETMQAGAQQSSSRSTPEDSRSKAEHIEEAAMGRNKEKKTRAERHAEAVQSAAEKRRAERLRRTEESLADLDAIVGSRTVSRAKDATAQPEDSDLGEEAPLTAREAADKANRKKSLRFYTSQIAQKANRRGAAGRGAGGDDDIPHRERLRDRQARLNAEAEKRGKRSGDVGDDLGGESEEEDHRQAQQIRADAEEDDYYDLVAARAAKKKSTKAALSEAQRQAALEGGRVVQEEIVDTDGKRKISYAIEKNKGLTPHRKKDVRNPRVKKRKKFDEKKKKLASIKPVYKGGEGRGGYGGELTGIKKGLIKSTKLS